MIPEGNPKLRVSQNTGFLAAQGSTRARGQADNVVVRACSQLHLQAFVIALLRASSQSKHGSTVGFEPGPVSKEACEDATAQLVP